MPRADSGSTKNSKPKPRPVFELRLYVAGTTRKSLEAIANLKAICAEHLDIKYHVEIIDLMKKPQLARAHQIVAIPTLVRKRPIPMCKIIGNLSDTERVLVGLDLRNTETKKIA